MSGHDRAGAGLRRISLLAVASLCLPLLVSGCGGFRQAIGLDRSGPDEFAVETRAPLTIPPDFDLRPPKPGAPRPQEGSAAAKAREAIDTAGPGEPGKQEAVGLHFSGSIPFGGGPDPNAEI